VRRSRLPVKGDGRREPGHIITSRAKTKRIRVIDLDPKTVEVLRAVLWTTVSPTDIIDTDAAASRRVFSDDAGEPPNPHQVSSRFQLAVASGKLRAIPLHGLRHTHAAILLSAGVPVHIGCAQLGHADPTITMNVCAHCLPRAQRAAVAVLAGMGAQRVR
jgi:integrase